MGGGIIPAMRLLTAGKYRFAALFAAAVFVALVGWVLLAGGPAEPAKFDQPARIQVISSEGVAVFEGELRQP